MKLPIRIGLIAILLGAVASAFAGYDLDGSLMRIEGLVDYSFNPAAVPPSSNNPFNSDCTVSKPFDVDGNPNTLGLDIDLGALSNGTIPGVVHASGTLNPSTGAVTLNYFITGQHIPVTYGTYNLDIQEISITLNATLSGHHLCFNGGAWRDIGASFTGNPATSQGYVKGTVTNFFNIPFTMTMSNIRWSGYPCRCGVDVKGHVNLQDWSIAPTGVAVEVLVRQGANVETTHTTLDASSNFAVTSELIGPIEVLVKPDRWMRQKKTGNTTGGSVTGLSFDVMNGDTDASNGVDDADLIDLILDFGSAPSGLYGLTDLDGDGTVNDVELIIMILNFDVHGDN